MAFLFDFAVCVQKTKAQVTNAPVCFFEVSTTNTVELVAAQQINQHREIILMLFVGQKYFELKYTVRKSYQNVYILF